MEKSSSAGVGLFGTTEGGRGSRVFSVATPLTDEDAVCRAAPSLSLGCSFEEIGEREFTTLAKWLPTNRHKTG